MCEQIAQGEAGARPKGVSAPPEEVCKPTPGYEGEAAVEKAPWASPLLPAPRSPPAWRRGQSFCWNSPA